MARKLARAGGLCQPRPARTRPVPPRNSTRRASGARATDGTADRPILPEPLRGAVVGGQGGRQAGWPKL